MIICKQFRDQSEQIEITRADNGRFFIEYGVTVSNGARCYTSSAGPFPSFEAAHATLQKHRPAAQLN